MIFVNSDDQSGQQQDNVDTDNNAPLTEAQISMHGFWPQIFDEIKRIKNVDARNQVLPLARIKKIMKLDDDVKMISAEAPLLFAKAAEIFIHELTLRAWVHTEDNKRRTLQRNDIAMAITKFDQFDFLIDIVPREEAKPTTVKKETATVVTCDSVQYYLQLAQQHQQALQGGGGVSTVVTQHQPQHIHQQQQQQQHQQQQPQQTIQLQSPVTSMGGGGGGQTSTVALAAPQNVINIQLPQQQNHHQQIQLVQQIVSANGEITHVPMNIPQSQLNLLRLQLQNQTNQHPIIIQQNAPMQGQQLLQVGQSAQPSGVYINIAQPSQDD